MATVYKKGTKIILPNEDDPQELPEDMTEEELLDALAEDESLNGISSDNLMIDDEGNVRVSNPKVRMNGATVYKKGTKIILPNEDDPQELPEDMTEEELLDALAEDESLNGISSDNLMIDDEGNVRVSNPKVRMNGATVYKKGTKIILPNEDDPQELPEDMTEEELLDALAEDESLNGISSDNLMIDDEGNVRVSNPKVRMNGATVYKKGTKIILPNEDDPQELPEDMTEEELLDALAEDESLNGISSDNLMIDDEGNVRVSNPKVRMNG